MATTYYFGIDAKLYYGDAGDPLASLAVANNVRDLTGTMDATEADVTTRANSGWSATAQGLRSLTLEWGMEWLPDDTAMLAIRDAFLDGTQIELCALDGLAATVGSQGPKGSFSITRFNRTASNAESIKVDVTAKLTEWDEWVEVEAGS